MNESNLKSAIESLLFVSGEPIKLSKLAKICEADKHEVVAEIEKLNISYTQEERGFTVVRKEDLVQLATNPKNSKYVSQLVSGELKSELSKSSLEVLSIVAYRGPVTRAQIETIRGVNCSYALRNLMVKGLIERKETSDIRGFLYEISFDFLKSLGIASVQDLPDWENLSKDGKVEEALNASNPENIAQKEE